jgi:hypothetical protein
VFTERDLVEREEKNNKVLALLRRKSKTKVLAVKRTLFFSFCSVSRGFIRFFLEIQSRSRKNVPISVGFAPMPDLFCNVTVPVLNRNCNATLISFAFHVPKRLNR